VTLFEERSVLCVIPIQDWLPPHLPLRYEMR